MDRYPRALPRHLHLSTVTVLMRERMEKFKHFFITFLAGAFVDGRVVVS